MYILNIAGVGIILSILVVIEKIINIDILNGIKLITPYKTSP